MNSLRKCYAQALLIAISLNLAGVDSMAAQSPATLATSAGKPILLTTDPVSVRLVPPSGAGLSALVARMPQSHKVYLVAKGLRTNTQPEALYQLYLGLPPGTAPKPEGIHFVGSVNFFNATKPGSAQADPRFFSFDVTDLIQSLRARKSLGDSASITIIPANRPNGAAKPLIGEIALIEQ